MASNTIRRSANTQLIDAPFEITGAATIGGALAVTGASMFTGAVTLTGGAIVSSTTIATAGTVAGKGLYVWNAADGAVNLPQTIASADGWRVQIANLNGTGSCTVTAPVVIYGAAGGATGGSALTVVLTPFTNAMFTGYAAGTCWWRS